MRFSTVSFVLVSALALTGCSIRQDVEPIRDQSESAICIIEKPAVREGVLQTMQEVLQEKGYSVTVLPQGSDIRACPLTATYHATWKWDLANYLGHARIEVFRDGRRVGQAEYDARSGGGNFKKFVNGREKIRELMETVFVGGASNRAGAWAPPQAPPPLVPGASSQPAASGQPSATPAKSPAASATSPATSGPQGKPLP